LFLISPNVVLVPWIVWDRLTLSKALDAFLACRLRKEASVVLDVLGLRRFASGSSGTADAVERRELRSWTLGADDSREASESGRLLVVPAEDETVEEEDDRLSRTL